MEDVLLIWHDYRLPLLVIASVILCALQLWRSTRKTENHVITHEKFAVVLEKSTAQILKQPTSPVQVPVPSVKESAVSDTVLLPLRRNAPKRIVGKKPSSNRQPTSMPSPQSEQIQPIIFFSSLSGSTEKTANIFTESLTNSLESRTNILKPQLLDLSDIDHDDYFTSLPKSADETPTRHFYIILVPSYNIDTYLDNFVEHLRETHHDFRIDTGTLSKLLGYAVFGFGDKEGWPTEAEGFCSQAKEVDKWMARLSGRKRAYPVGMGDVKSDAEERLNEWRKGIEDIIRDLADGKTFGEGVEGSGEAVESDDEEEEEADDSASESTKRVTKRNKKKRQAATSDDMENLGTSLATSSPPTDTSVPLAIDFTTYSTKSPPPPTRKEMVPTSSPTYTALTKQGYTIVGSHSGVKICRWTKSALRGRGSCYKFSFYGIKSHLCMETTPSLSCSNKCVFCWRHGTNPVGTTWRWVVDPPEMIFNGVKEGHYKKIKMMRGVPGVRAERFEEAMRIRHCALSLVGEPIFYPYINEFVAMLHAERISSFLVCNAQHPAQLATLKTVTQLYVSIDAANRDSLRRIDRPLHRDFWERLLACLDILRERRFRQRTVFRLTLVKGFNIDDEVQGYADLIARGLPCFVEVKGVTYCGTSTSAGAGLTMQNVPFYSEVQDFVHELEVALRARGLDYGIAAEHAHSCCVLIGSERFLRDGVWHTVINYEKFFELLESGKEFSPEEYCSPTAEWAWWGNGGFDPADERVVRKRGKIVSAKVEAEAMDF